MRAYPIESKLEKLEDSEYGIKNNRIQEQDNPRR